MSYAKKREREILHRYLEVLAHNYEKIEPDEMAGSMTKIYNSLNRGVKDLGCRRLVVLCGINLFVSITIFLVNIRRLKTG